jgi:uncharacterized membrane protein YhiD involved in acid resistance
MREKIKMFAWILIACVAIMFKPMTAWAGGEEKKVCETKVDPKTKKEKEVCKTIKVHKKVEGDKVPDAKKK